MPHVPGHTIGTTAQGSSGQYKPIKPKDNKGAYIASTSGGTAPAGSNPALSKPKKKIKFTDSKEKYLSETAGGTGGDTSQQISNIKQSVGSLDRRIEKLLAAEKPNLDLIKELRKKQKNFVNQLGLASAHQAMINAAPLSQKDKIKKQIKDNPNFLNSTGSAVFQEFMDTDFIDPTRKLQNLYPDVYSDLYPISSALQGGLPAVQLIKKGFGVDEKPIPYTLEDMPGIRYPLLRTPVTTLSDRQDPLDETPFTISDRPPGLDDFPKSNVASEEQKQAAIDRGISPEFIFSLPDDPRTDLIESDLNTGTALQLAEAANTKGELADILPEDASLEAQAELSEFLNRPTMTFPNVFALPESSKEALNKQAELNRKEYELQTYGKEITLDDLAKADINPAFYNQKFSTPIIQQQLLKAGVLENEQVQPALQEKTFASPETKTFAPILGLQDQNVLLPGSQVSGADYLTQVAENNEMAKNQIMNNDSLNIIQKEQLINDLDKTTNFTPFTDPLFADSDPVFFDQYMSDALSKLR